MNVRDLERDAAVASLYIQGMKMRDIGAKFGISHQRVQQIVRRVGAQRPPRPEPVVTCHRCKQDVLRSDFRAHRDEPACYFWSYVRQGEGCWEWQGVLMYNGYGRLFRHGAYIYAHRYAWSLTNGPIPAGLHVLHHCDNPPCVNPAHLYAGTALDNARDRDSRGRDAKSRGYVAPKRSEYKTRCVHGHRYTPANTLRWADGVRRCRSCARERHRAYRARKKLARSFSVQTPN